MDLLQAVANAVRGLHDAGLLHRDLGNQNVGLRRDPADPAAPWQVCFLDLNRAQRTAAPTPAQRGADLARLDLPSDFRRVFHAMYFHGHAPSAEFAEAEALSAVGLGDTHRGQAEFGIELAPGGGLEAGIGFHQAPHLLGGRALAEKPAQAGPEFFLLAGEAELHRKSSQRRF